MPQILHLVPDEKFIDAAHRQFESANPGKNTWVIIGSQRPLTYIKSTPVTFFPAWKTLSRSQVAQICQGHTAIVLHSTDKNRLFFLKNTPQNIVKVWIGWGADYYDILGIPLFLPETQKIIQGMKTSPQKALKDILKKIASSVGISKPNILKSIDIFCPVLPNEYPMVKGKIPGFNAIYIPWNYDYGTLEGTPSVLPENETRNILIGNSATPTNNHAEAMEITSKLSLENRQVIVPLGYGDMTYGAIIKQLGKKLFGGKFTPITYLPQPEYVKLTTSCGTVIMNHIRQQAVGNILTTLFRGAKVFLNKNNPVYSYLKENGIAVFRIEDLPTEDKNPPLSAQTIKKTQDFIKENWSGAAQIAKTKILVKAIEDRNKR